MLDKEMQEILEEESALPKCLCCGLSFIATEDELICNSCAKKLSDVEYNVLTGKTHENIRKNRRKQNLLTATEM